MKRNLLELGGRFAALRTFNNPTLPSTITTTSSIFRSFSSSSSSAPLSAASNSKLFVAGLSWSVDERSLKDAFSTYGDVTEVRIMYDKDTGRSRGFGFVYFSKEDEATCAKDAMDGKAFLGRPLRISFALDKVRGAPVVVPRLRNTGNAAGQND